MYDFNCIVVKAFRTLKNVFPGEYTSNACVLKQTVILFLILSELGDWGLTSRNSGENLEFPYVIYIGILREIHGFWWFFNSQYLYLRAQTIFFITVCFKTQAFDVYSREIKFLRLLNASEKNGVRYSQWHPPSRRISNYHPHNMRGVIWDVSWGGGRWMFSCVRFFWSIVALYGRYSALEGSSQICF